MKHEKLLSMFNAINIDPADNLNLSTEDQTFCLKVQEDFDLIMENLKDYQALFSNLEKQDRFPKSLNVLYRSLAFLPAPIISDINEKRQKAIKAFTESVLDYFSKRYNLKETDNLNIPQKPTLTYKDIVSKIIAHFGNLDRAGERFLIKEFQSNICSRRLGDKLEGAKITFTHAFFYSTSFNGNLYLSYNSRKNIESLVKAISFFETGQIADIIDSVGKTLPDCCSRDEVNFNSVYELTGLSKVKGVKFFKNGRLDILFYSPVLAEEFFKLFDCVDVKTVKGDNR